MCSLEVVKLYAGKSCIGCNRLYLQPNTTYTTYNPYAREEGSEWVNPRLNHLNH